MLSFAKRALVRFSQPGGLRLSFVLLKRWIFDSILIKLLPTPIYFQFVYHCNYWLDGESRSGPGSSLSQTSNIRKILPSLISRYPISVVFDAPCGDFTWMSQIVAAGSFKYIGFDIVPGLISSNKAKYSSVPGVEFRVSDITSSPFPSADIWICRDILFHLSNADIAALFCRFMESSIPYLLVTSHLRGSSELPAVNSDIKTGSFRPIILSLPPFSFPDTPLERFLDYEPPHLPREMRLYTRSQLMASIRAFGSAQA